MRNWLTCGAKNRRGQPCQCKQLYENGRCKYHGGLSTGPRTPEGKARSLAALRAGRTAWAEARRNGAAKNAKKSTRASRLGTKAASAKLVFTNEKDRRKASVLLLTPLELRAVLTNIRIKEGEKARNLAALQGLTKRLEGLLK